MTNHNAYLGVGCILFDSSFTIELKKRNLRRKIGIQTWKKRIIVISQIQGPVTNRSQSNGSSVKMLTQFQSCSKSNRRECLADTNSCFSCGKWIMR